MQHRTLGKSELSVSEICLGTMTWGEQNTLQEAREQLAHAIAAGVNFIDVAEMYPVPPRAETQGRSEAILGQLLKERRRQDLVIATKITAPGRGFGWVRGGPKAIDLQGKTFKITQFQPTNIQMWEQNETDGFFFNDAGNNPETGGEGVSQRHSNGAYDETRKNAGGGAIC